MDFLITLNSNLVENTLKKLIKNLYRVYHPYKLRNFCKENDYPLEYSNFLSGIEKTYQFIVWLFNRKII